MNNKERLELARWASEYARKKGALESAVSISRSRSVQVEVREQKIETIRESTSNNLSLQIYRNNKFSSHSTNFLQKSQLERFISEAVAATDYLSPDADRVLPDPSLYPTDLSKNLKLVDPAYGNVTPEFRLNTAMETEKLIKEVKPDVLSVSTSFNDNTSEGVRVHSNGFSGETAGTSYSAGASITILDAGARPAGYYYVGARFLDKLPNPFEIAELALFDTLRQVGQTKIASGKYNMLVDNRIAGNLVFRLFQPMSARNIQQRSSFLLDMIGKSIASPFLTIVDDPFIEEGMASRLFDSEGIAASRRTMIDKGVLQQYYIDNYYGRKLGLTPNGGSPSNILMEQGSRSQSEIIATQNKAILVTSFNGGNANTTTGDFSFGISGQLIEKGKITRAVNEMNISGNFLRLWNQLIETGSDPYPYSSMRTPTLVFRDVDFSGL